MATRASTPAGGRASGAAAANGSPASSTGPASFAATWLDAALAWQVAAWAANLEAMRLTQRAYQADTWAELGRRWASMLHNGPIPA